MTSTSPDDLGHPAGRSLTQLDNSQKAIRDTTKWLVAAAAAVGAVVVAGLQLSNLPTGAVATTMAVSGFVIALLGVAVIIFTAAGVLSVGFTTLGQLAELNEPEARRIQAERRWKSKIDHAAHEGHRLSPLRLWSWIRRQTLSLGLSLFVRYAKWEGVQIAELKDYLEEDAIVFSNGLAGTINGLYDLIARTDREILLLRGETPWSPDQPSKARAARPLVGKDSADALSQAAWRSTVLATAAGTLIAFANQKIIEHRFQQLKWAVRVGGAAVAIGVGLFALAPKVAQPKPLAVDTPTNVTIVVKRPKVFGKGCTDMQLSGVALGGSWSRPIIVTRPTSSCPSKRLTLTARTGFAVPVISSSSAGGARP
jgi:hypothetical protein